MAIDGLLSAPITGRSCVAYEVGVKLKDASSYRSEVWLLHESHGTSFFVGDARVKAGRVALGLPMHRIDLKDLEEGKLERFLRERGLSWHDGALEVYEAYLNEGEEAEVEVHTEPDVSIVTLPRDSNGLGRKRGPYR